MTASPITSRSGLALLVFVLACLAQALLALNPGYFSHDELQWGAAADVASWHDLPWMAWTDIATFQWRPLTFNAWLLLSHALFETPVGFHLLWVALGSAIAGGLAVLLSRLGLAPATAGGAALVFALNPYAAHVHGWVATLADLIWVACALTLAHLVLTAHRQAWRGPVVAALAFALTALGLMAKEAAVVMPALLVVVWLAYDRPRALAWAMAGSGGVVLAYLALRWGVLMPDASRGSYGTSLAFVHGNLAAFALYPLRPSTFEVQGLMPMPAAAMAVAVALWLGLLLAMRRSAPRLALLLVAGGTLALAPVLVLESIANQYAYGGSAWAVACVALAWPSLRKPGKALVIFLALVLVWHGVNVQREMRAVGERQAVFQPALAEALRTHPGVLKLYAEPRHAWAYRRLTHEVPAWRGEAIGERVLLVESAEGADFVIGVEGELRRVEPDRD